MWKEWLFFYLIYSQTPSRTSSLPWEISLNLSRRRTSVLCYHLTVIVKYKEISLSRPEPSHQRRDREVDSTLRLGTFRFLPPGSSSPLSPVLCFLLPDIFLLWALRNNLGFFGKLSELQNISVGLLKWPLACHLLACCSRNVRVSLSCGRETLSFQVLKMPRGCGWATKSFGPVFGEEAVWTHWWAGWLVRGPRTFWPPAPSPF